MSPSKRKELMTTINKERFKAALNEEGIMQSFLARDVIHVSTEHFSRKINSGVIEKEWMEKICDVLNISSEYLSGKSDEPLTRLAEKRGNTDSKGAIKEFLISRGFEPGRADALDETDINEIEYFISYKCKNPHTRIFDFQTWISDLIKNQ